MIGFIIGPRLNPKPYSHWADEDDGGGGREEKNMRKKEAFSKFVGTEMSLKCHEWRIFFCEFPSKTIQPLLKHSEDLHVRTVSFQKEEAIKETQDRLQELQNAPYVVITRRCIYRSRPANPVL